MATIRRFLRSQDGTTAIEYGLIVMLISIVGVALFIQIGAGIGVPLITASETLR